MLLDSQVAFSFSLSLWGKCEGGRCGGRGERGPQFLPLATGPGAYDVPSGDRGPRYSMGSRQGSLSTSGDMPGRISFLFFPSFIIIID
jgi:hypothetical protein